MSDIDHVFGQDLQWSASGDLALADGDTETRQRLLRRLLTNPGDDLWQPDYGAGLGQYIGLPVDVASITTLITQQALLEPTVAPMPAPKVRVSEVQGGLAVDIRYASAVDGSMQGLAFAVS